MPDGTTAPAPCEATTPTLGVRLWIARDRDDLQDMVCLQVGNEGGRGKALAAVVVPVERLPGLRVRPLMDLDALNDKGVQELHWRDNNVLPTPFSLRWYGDQWRRITRDATEWVMVLMIYANPRVPQGSPAATSDQVAALKAFFFDDDGQTAAQAANKIRRGLVRLAVADIPSSVKPIAPAPPQTEPPPAVAPPAVAPPAAAPSAVAFTFALASCQYPAGLVDGTPQRHGAGGRRALTPPGPADAAMLRLARRLDDPTPDDKTRPSLLVLTGDQIYADATAGLFDPRAGGTPKARSSVRDAEDWLRIPYQNWFGSVGAQSVLGLIPSRMMLDDHEIDDNWQPLGAAARPAEARRIDLLLQAGRQGYQRYQRDVREAELLPVLWQTCRHRGLRFFLADTRTERGPRQAAQDPLRPCIMSGLQASELHDWIADETAEPAAPAFVVSPAMLLPRRRSSTARPRAALHSDAWDGYPGSLHRLLVHIWKTGRSNLVFLSGDEHLSGVVKATITQVGVRGRDVVLHSVHSSGLYSPYPFANAVPELFALPDGWTFCDPDEPGTKYCCEVRPCGPWVPGDGFALLSLAPPPAGSGSVDWRLDVRFDRATGEVLAPQPLVLAPGPGPLQPPPA